MFGIGTTEMIVFAIIALFYIAGVAALIAVAVVVLKGNKRKQD